MLSDVYKRQEGGIMTTQAKPGALKEHSQIRAGRALQMRLKTDYHLLRRTDICQIQFKQSYSVSYTHLDVYKRQGLGNLEVIFVCTICNHQGDGL